MKAVTAASFVILVLLDGQFKGTEAVIGMYTSPTRYFNSFRATTLRVMGRKESSKTSQLGWQKPRGFLLPLGGGGGGSV